MAQSNDKENDQTIRKLIKEYADQGISVRREKLCRGPAFRVKSGQCFLAEQKLFFLDKRLPSSQQVTLLSDHLGALRKEAC